MSKLIQEMKQSVYGAYRQGEKAINNWGAKKSLILSKYVS